MKVTYFTNTGPHRQKNEDAIVVNEKVVWSENMLEPVETDVFTLDPVFATIDGMGGHVGGEIASLVTSMELTAKIDKCKFREEPSEHSAKKVIKWLIKELGDVAVKVPKLNDMGATIAVVLVKESKIIIFNIGDARCYRIRNNKIEIISYDHSEVQELVDKGKITEEEARNHPMKNIVRGAVTPGGEYFKVFYKEYDREENDIFLVCTDGVWETIEKDVLKNCILSNKNLAHFLLEENICRDNISYILIK